MMLFTTRQARRARVKCRWTLQLTDLAHIRCRISTRDMLMNIAKTFYGTGFADFSRASLVWARRARQKCAARSDRESAHAVSRSIHAVSRRRTCGPRSTLLQSRADRQCSHCRRHRGHCEPALCPSPARGPGMLPGHGVFGQRSISRAELRNALSPRSGGLPAWAEFCDETPTYRDRRNWKENNTRCPVIPTFRARRPSETFRPVSGRGARR
jgi:hypothetical protein